MSPNIIKPKLTNLKPKIPAWGKPITPTVPMPTVRTDQTLPPKGKPKPPKSERPMIKPAYGTWQPPKQPNPTFQQTIGDVRVRLRAMFDQLAKFNPNTWGVSGSGTFQGLNAPTSGPSAQELINKANGGY